MPATSVSGGAIMVIAYAVVVVTGSL